jgi:hypothetical protein
MERLELEKISKALALPLAPHIPDVWFATRK